MSNIDFINEHFKLPIFYNNKRKNLNTNIITDLELIKSHDSSNNSLYSFILNNDNIFSKKIIEQVSEYYTSDTFFLKDSQLLLQNYSKNNYDKQCIEDIKIMELWDEIKNETSFKEKYYYIDWPIWDFLNKSDVFLQVMSIYNMSSPILSLLTPVIILIIPFFVIKLKGLNLTIQEYTDIIQHILSNHAIGKLGKLFTDFHSISNEQKMFIVTSVAFYFFSIYQNILLCQRFSNNMVKIHNYFYNINLYLERTLSNMNNLIQYTSSLSSYKEFNEKLNYNIDVLNNFREKIKNYGNFNLFQKRSLHKICEIGSILKNFYELKYDETYNSAFLYSFGFNGYIINLEKIIQNIDNKNLNFVEFLTKEDKNKNNFQGGYYGPLVKKHVKNNLKLKKNIIITGPNASGKTTVLKSTLINILLSQQFGCGFYKKAQLFPYTFIHSYLNIPDTSGRDSLFQAEARRCKEIIDIINTNKDETHFCIFDELYSGTNPDEAFISSLLFMEYLVKFNNVSCLLTTHFTKVCKKLKDNKNILNLRMNTEYINNDFVYTYKLQNGISYVKGGLKVLYDMNYPEEILIKANKYINK